MRSFLSILMPLMFLLSQPVLAQDCTSPNADLGVIIYNADHAVWKGCTQRGWIGLNAMVCPDGDGSSSDPCAFEGSCSTPTPGTECADGSFYIGDSPEDGAPVFMTAAVHETGIRWDEDPPCYRCGLNDTGATSITDGRANVEALRAYGGDNATAGNLDGFGAAKYCDNLTNVHGHDDWYLPAGGDGAGTEQNLFWLMAQAEGAVGGLDTSGSRYWSSFESKSTNARNQQFNDGLQKGGYKNTALLVRCVRR